MVPLCFNTSSVPNLLLENIRCHAGKGGRKFPSRSEQGSAREGCQLRKQAWCILSSSYSAALCGWIALQGEFHLSMGFCLVGLGVFCWHYNAFLQPTEILNKYFNASYFISFCCFHKETHTSFALTFPSVKSDNTGLGVRQARLSLSPVHVLPRGKARQV